MGSSSNAKRALTRGENRRWEELGLRDGRGELGEGVGDVESGRERVGH
jgi:hypothetical protein